MDVTPTPDPTVRERARMAEEDRRSALRQGAESHRIEVARLRREVRSLRYQLENVEKRSEQELLGLAHSIARKEEHCELQNWKNRRTIKKMWASEVKRALEPVLVDLKEQQNLVNVQHFGLLRLEKENQKLTKTLELQRDLNRRLMERLRGEQEKKK